jgi:PII-like signaling protein
MATSYQLVSLYLNEGDEWEQRPLHHEVLQYLYRSGCAGGTVLRGLAGFTGKVGGPGSSGGRPPVVVQFIEVADKVAQVMPTLRRMAGHRLITLQDVQIVAPES